VGAVTIYTSFKMHGMNIKKINMWKFISTSAHNCIVRKSTDKLQVLLIPGYMRNKHVQTFRKQLQV